jgi:hypothetical protein
MEINMKKNEILATVKRIEDVETCCLTVEPYVVIGKSGAKYYDGTKKECKEWIDEPENQETVNQEENRQ